MKIAISASGPNLDAEVDPRFGRCQYFIIAEPETMEFEAINNSSASAAGGAGISAAQSIVDKGVVAVLTGNCGPNAHQVLVSAGIPIITGVSGKIEDVIKDYRAGNYEASARANVPDHFGMGSPGMGGASGMGGGSGMGRGMGGGRGMGKGGGRGMGMGGGMGGGMGTGAGMMPPAGPMPQSQNLEQEVQALKAQSQALAEQLAEIQRQIKKLGDKTG